MKKNKEFDVEDVFKEVDRSVFPVYDILCSNGWTPAEDGCNKRTRNGDGISGEFFYSRFFCHDVATVQIIVSCEPRDLDEVLGFGVCDISITEYSSKYFSMEVVKDMERILKNAEDNLVKIGIPFVSGYEFHSRKAANNTRRNEALRKKYHLDLLEDEYM